MTPARRIQISIAVALGGAAALTVFTPEAVAEKSPDGGVVERCVMPNTTDEREVDCYGIKELGLPDGGPRWRGKVTMPATHAYGDDCIETPCTGNGQDTLVKKSGGFFSRDKMEWDNGGKK